MLYLAYFIVLWLYDDKKYGITFVKMSLISSFIIYAVKEFIHDKRKKKLDKIINGYDTYVASKEKNNFI